MPDAFRSRKIRGIMMGWALCVSCAFGQDPPQYGAPFQKVPDPRDVVMYQVNMRVFSQTRNFQGVTDRLDKIRALGVNVVYLMPIFPVGILKGINSPYSPKDFKSIGAEFGSIDDLRALIEEAHKRDMAVILDWIADHTSWDNPWITQNPSWYEHDSAGNIVSPNGWMDSAKLNYQNQDLRSAMIEAMRYWIFTVNCDGFRCDYADGVPVDFWQQANASIRSITTHKFILMAEGGRQTNFTAFDFNFGFSFYDQLKAIYGANQPVTKLDAINTATYAGAVSPSNQVVRYTTNHDVNSSDGTPLALFGGRAGSLAAFTVVAYMKSVPMLYNGQEVGTPYPLKFPFTGTPIDWTINPDMPADYAKIISVRNNSEAIRRGTLRAFSNNDVCAFTKTSGINKALILINLRNAKLDFPLADSVASGVWYDAFTGNKAAVTSTMTLQPFEYKVMTNAVTTAILARPLSAKSKSGISIHRNGKDYLMSGAMIPVAAPSPDKTR